MQKDGKDYPKDSKIQLIDNFPAFLFTRIEVKKHGKVLDEIENPGVLSTIKGVLCYSVDPNGPIINSGFLSKYKGGGRFNVLTEVSQLGLGFFKIPYPVFNGDIEINFTRNTDDDALLKKVVIGTEDGKISSIPNCHDKLPNDILQNPGFNFLYHHKYRDTIRRYDIRSCPSVFNAKRNLVAHQKTHTGIRFPCTICPSTFKYKHHLNRHYKNVHGFVKIPAHHGARKNVITPQIQIAPQIIVPDIPAGGSNMISDDDICMLAIDAYEMLDASTVMAEQDEYSSKGSSYTLQCIDGLLLDVYQYTPMSGSSYMPLPEFIERKKAIINPQNSNQQCFKWAILAKHVTGSNKQRIENYTMHEEKYNFSGLTFPKKLHQKTRYKASGVFYKRRFTSFEPLNINKYELNERIRFEEQKLICRTHKTILPRKPAHGSMLEFNSWKKNQRHPIVIYANFEALLRKSDEKCENNTKAIQKHEAMSYGFMVKANNDVPAELLEQFNIPTSPIIFRADEDNQNVGEHFVKSIVEIAENIEKLL
ncbi:Uncharacterized protein FWK35_00029659, partial [Aphis craccivora]